MPSSNHWLTISHMFSNTWLYLNKIGTAIPLNLLLRGKANFEDLTKFAKSFANCNLICC